MVEVGAVARHYAGEGDGGAAIVGRVVAAVREMGGAVTVAGLAPFDHFHGRGLAATQELLAALGAVADDAVLDIGSGIGGPARWIAAATGCSVTGVDLTAAFCEAAVALNGMVGLAGRVRILQGSATALPVPDGEFDRAYSQNVVMNIADKGAVYREARRALRPGGRLVLSHLEAGVGEVVFPVPWATTGQESFLAGEGETRREVAAAEFEVVSVRDVSEAALAGRAVPGEGVLAPGPHVIMGSARFGEMMRNMGRNMAEGRVRSVEVVAVAV